MFNCVKKCVQLDVLFPLRRPQRRSEEVWHLCRPPGAYVHSSQMRHLSFGDSSHGRGRNPLGSGTSLFTMRRCLFRELRCSCEFIRERVKWKHSQVSGGLFLASPIQHICLFPLNQAAGSCRGNYLQLNPPCRRYWQAGFPLPTK